jgi:hypothetical protein
MPCEQENVAMDVATAIEATRKANYTATETTFFPNSGLQRRGILLNPGQHVLSEDGFFQFVQNGCKEPAKYKIGEGFQAVLNKDINKRLAELYEAQRPFVEAVPADVADQHSRSQAELEGYAERKKEIEYLEEERIRIQNWFDALDAQRNHPR